MHGAALGLSIAAIVVAGIGLVAAGWGTVRLYRIDPDAYGYYAKPGIPTPGPFQDPARVRDLLFDQREAVRPILLGAVVQVAAVGLQLAAVLVNASAH